MPGTRPTLTRSGLAASIPRALALCCLLFASAGCSTECRSLCTTWYDNLRDVCQELDTDDDRVRCISDYRAARVSDAELEQCAGQEVDVRRIAARGDDCLCDGDESDCNEGDDDDSSTP